MQKFSRYATLMTAVFSLILLSACGGGGGGGGGTTATVDTTPPVITVIGDNPVTITVGSTYTDAGASAYDAIDGNLTAQIVTTDNVDTSTPGTYTVTYSVSDSSDNNATATRTVQVTVSLSGSGFAMSIDVDESTVTADWESNSGALDTDGDPITATVKTNGTLGTCTVSSGTLTYTKTTEGNETDSCILTLTGGTESIDITVTIHALYWVEVAAGEYHALALKSDGTIWSWGDNSYGMLGLGDTTDRHVPTQIGDGSDWRAVAVGEYHSIALRNDGTIWTWGYNHDGQLGDATNTQQEVPVQESTHATNWAAIAGGTEHTIALKSNGTIWGWGDNSNGQVGDGTTVNRNTPTQESTHATDWAKIAAGTSHTVALKTNDTLWGWGGNNYGQLGDATSTNRSNPTQENTHATDWTKIAVGYYNTVAIKNNSTLWTWGYNGYGQLGDGTTTESHVPIQEVTHATDWTTIAAMAHTLAIKSDGYLWAWGYNSEGELGLGTSTSTSIPAQVGSGSWAALAAAEYFSVGIRSDGTLWTWGYNGDGELGLGDTVERHVPTAVFTRP